MNKGIIIACDVREIYTLTALVRETCNIEGIVGYKVGFSLVITYGLKQVCKAIRLYTDKEIMYDHQKAGNDIPDTGSLFADVCKDAGVDSVILFPFTGPNTLYKWVQECYNRGLKVIVGGHMTHGGFIEQEGGFICTYGPERIYRRAALLGIRDFVVPGNNIRLAKKYCSVIDEVIDTKYTIYAPGFGVQGGSVSTFVDNFVAIIGRSIYEQEYKTIAAKRLVRDLYGEECT